MKFSITLTELWSHRTCVWLLLATSQGVQQMVVNWAVNSRFLNSSCFKIACKVDEMGSSQLLFPPGLCGSLLSEMWCFPPLISTIWELFFSFYFSFFLKFIWRPGWYIALARRYVLGTAQEWIPKKTICRKSICSHAVILQVLLPCIPEAPYNTDPADWERSRLAKIFIFVCVCVYIDMTTICIYERVQLNSTEFLWVFKALQFYLPNTGKKVLGFCLCFCIGFWLRWLMWPWLGWWL